MCLGGSLLTTRHILFYLHTANATTTSKRQLASLSAWRWLASLANPPSSLCRKTRAREPLLKKFRPFLPQKIAERWTIFYGALYKYSGPENNSLRYLLFFFRFYLIPNHPCHKTIHHKNCNRTNLYPLTLSA